MKLLLVLLALMLGVWLWRSGRGKVAEKKNAKPNGPGAAPAEQPQDMLACKLCGLHVPRAEALIGPTGSYCCAEHLRRAEP